MDDVKFTDAMLDDIERRPSIDRALVFATRHSNGAMMAYRLACELADRIAPIAPVGGTLGIKDCKPSRAVSVLHIHGLRDQNSPFEGGVGSHSLSRSDVQSNEQTIAKWVELNGCDADSASVVNAEGFRTTTYRAQSGAEVVLVAVDRMGHTWPGGEAIASANFAGPTPQSPSANEWLWNFFVRYPLGSRRQ